MSDLIECLKKSEGPEYYIWQLRMFTLERLYDIQHEEGNCLSFDGFDLPREIVRGLLRDLREKGLVQYQRGLFCAGSGQPYGSGYSITQEGASFYKQAVQATGETGDV